MNICFPSLNYPINGGASSGVGSQVRLLAHSLIDSGNSVSVIDLAETEQFTPSDDHGAEIHRVRSGTLHWFAGKLPFVGNVLALPIREIEYSAAVWRGIRRVSKLRKLDLIEGTETGMLLVAMFCRKVPFIIRLHGEKYTFHKYTPGIRLTLGVRLSRMLQRLALRRAKALISPSYAHAREIAQELGRDPGSIRIIPNCTELNGIPSRPVHASENSIVLFVGRLEQV
jgi:glycosyltransferase involved in cell wall biosynthesis